MDARRLMERQGGSAGIVHQIRPLASVVLLFAAHQDPVEGDEADSGPIP